MSFFWQAVWVEGGLAIIALIAGMFVGLNYGEYIWCNGETIFQIVLGLLPLIAGYFILLAIPLGALRRIDSFVRELFRQYMMRLSLGQLALIAALAGIGEELFFRGLLQIGLTNIWGLWPAVVVSSFIFGLAHAVTFTYFILAFVISLYFGFLFEYTGNLVVPIAIHAFYDFFVFLYIRSTLIKEDCDGKTTEQALNAIKKADE